MNRTDLWSESHVSSGNFVAGGCQLLVDNRHAFCVLGLSHRLRLTGQRDFRQLSEIDLRTLGVSIRGILVKGYFLLIGCNPGHDFMKKNCLPTGRSRPLVPMRLNLTRALMEALMTPSPSILCHHAVLYHSLLVRLESKLLCDLLAFRPSSCPCRCLHSDNG